MDRRRVRRVPPPARAASAAPLTEAACLDPLILTDPARLYAASPPIRPECWETIDESDGVARERLIFPSTAPGGIVPNDQVSVHFYRPVHRRSSYNLLVLHGIWRQDQRFEHWFCHELARAGVSSALLTLPFHWERAPRDAPSGALFVSADPLWTAAAFRQAIMDARGVLGLLRGRGTPVGVVGFSLGGILAHILMALEPVDLGMSVLAGGNIAGIVWESLLTRAHRRAMEARGVTFPRLAALWAAGNPTRYAWRAKPSRLLMVNAQYDLLVPRHFTEELWRALGQPPIRWLPAGHITTFLFRRAMMSEILAAMGIERLVGPSRSHMRIPGMRSGSRAEVF
jgi:dienelactone hydrolase